MGWRGWRGRGRGEGGVLDDTGKRYHPVLTNMDSQIKSAPTITHSIPASGCQWVKVDLHLDTSLSDSQHRANQEDPANVQKEKRTSQGCKTRMGPLLRRHNLKEVILIKCEDKMNNQI